jgi:hypothetical protein
MGPTNQHAVAFPIFLGTVHCRPSRQGNSDATLTPEYAVAARKQGALLLGNIGFM